MIEQKILNPDLSKLGIDECYVKIKIFNETSAWLYTLYDECYKCPYNIIQNLIPINETYMQYTALPSRKWRIQRSGENNISMSDQNKDVICDFEPKFSEFGIYELDIRENNCSTRTIEDSVNIYYPLLIGTAIILLLCIINVIISWINRLGKENGIVLSNVRDANSKISSRVSAIDTFRGISLMIMVFVNFGAGSYDILNHITWNGLHIADVLFPWFMWIMGTCIPIAFQSQLKKNVPRIKIFKHIVKRSIILFLLGVMINTMDLSTPQISEIRIFGVYQRFGVCYLVVASMYLFLSRRKYDTVMNNKLALFFDIIILLPQWFVVALIVAGHTCLIFLYPVPGCPKGYLGPGGLQDYPNYINCTGGATGYLDKLILGETHIYQYPTSQLIYQSSAYDPEGLIGCMTSIFQVFLGLQAGSILLIHKTHRSRICRWCIWAVVTSIIGGLLCKFCKEDGWIPLNKNLWSLSFVLVTSSMAFILLCFLYILIDVYNVWSGKPFLFPGMNSTIVYVGHEVTHSMFPIHWAIGSMNTHLVRLMENMWASGCWVFIAYWLWKIEFFLKI